MQKVTSFFIGIAATLAVSAPLISSAQIASFGSTGISSTAAVSAQYCPQLAGSLMIGSRGSYVSALQQYLNQRYGNQLVTGYFGTATRANVIRLQEEMGISPIGIVGPLTRGTIQKWCTGNGGGTGWGGGTTSTSLSANPSAGTAPLSVSFNGSVADGNTYIIDYGDGSNSGPLQASCPTLQPYPAYNDLHTSCTISASHTYASIGTYTAHMEQYLACLWSEPRCMTFAAQKNLGQVTITVTSPVTLGGITVSSPVAGATYARGQDMTISWGYPVTPNSTPMVIELYTAAGTPIGPIAVSNATSGSYPWHIPGFPQNYMCTQQYPNGLCGASIPNGQYYIKVSAEQNALSGNPTVIASGQSGVFTIVGAQ